MEPDAIDRIAQALFIEHEKMPGRPVRYNCGWRHLPTHLKEKYKRAAKDALTACEQTSLAQRLSPSDPYTVRQYERAILDD